MIDPLMSIGMFVFGVPRTTFDEMERRASWRWAESERYGARPASQFLGPGTEVLRIAGLLVPEIAGSFGDIERLREMAATGEVWPVMLGTGDLLGNFRIDSIDERRRTIMGGGLARHTEFVLELTRVDDEA